jgi:hypothetical protein
MKLLTAEIAEKRPQIAENRNICVLFSVISVFPMVKDLGFLCGLGLLASAYSAVKSC